LRGGEVIDVGLPEAVDPVLAASVVYAFVRAGDPLPAELTVAIGPQTFSGSFKARPR
jgi:hypothetical protein